jgi:amidase
MLMPATDDPEVAHGTPVGFQLVGKRLQEEKMIAVAELLEKALADRQVS